MTIIFSASLKNVTPIFFYEKLYIEASTYQKIVVTFFRLASGQKNMIPK